MLCESSRIYIYTYTHTTTKKNINRTEHSASRAQGHCDNGPQETQTIYTQERIRAEKKHVRNTAEHSVTDEMGSRTEHNAHRKSVMAGITGVFVEWTQKQKWKK